jgi:hypothetical protein
MTRAALNLLLDGLGADGDGLRAAIDAMTNEAIGNPHARSFLAAVEWIAAQDQRTPAERVVAMAELSSLRGRGGVMQLSMQEFTRDWCGWRDDSDA